MLDRIVIHIGPGKCGSSSIQNFFISKNLSNEKVKLIKVEPCLINKLNTVIIEEREVENLNEILEKHMRHFQILILSHEVLFQFPLSIKNIYSLCDRLVPNVTIIGYSRTQSSFIISAYSQWFFRSKDRVKEILQEFVNHKMVPTLYTGLERQLIGSILNDFYSARQLSNILILNWNQSYGSLVKLLKKSKAIIRCGILPTNKNKNQTLIRDFCEKANISLHSGIESTDFELTNSSFNSTLVEAINIALTIGKKVPGPHEQNEKLIALSKDMEEVKTHESKFINQLKSYVDSYFYASNTLLCDRFELDVNYYKPGEFLSKKDIIEIIKKENQRRKQDL